MRRQAAIALALGYGAVCSHIHARFPHNVQTALLLVTLPLTSIVVLLLSFRAISIDDAVHARLTHNYTDYQSALRGRVILSNDGFATLVRMLLGLNVITSIPIFWNQLSQSSLSSRISTPLAYLFGIGSVLVAVMCILMSLTQPLMSVNFDRGDSNDKGDGFPHEIPDALVPIKVLSAYLIRHPGVDGWHKVGTTSRRHDVHARVDSATQSYEIRTVWSQDHPAMAGRPAPGAPALSTSAGVAGKLDQL
ncbi:uncharacterized protein PFL1_00335 [Pseudozyma flocculosa PF-1]|uniref:Uncharacterized protein n=1 Tax=Pseudozyma flocculosa TaxID=84751 RepID=A0A5C3ERH6_9BASI|nr:uncharacterized protein PFL1_00335 [Pseudozyma flocculosa PF-1]EPQ32138.1 hypothetical protein PFL1_00335 [Pseudozyma flocculosa PF-1]SPO34923.1 uncharacterized protein PSFLO_00394 [Pseudozyma flocculosa]